MSRTNDRSDAPAAYTIDVREADALQQLFSAVLRGDVNSARTIAKSPAGTSIYSKAVVLRRQVKRQKGATDA